MTAGRIYGPGPIRCRTAVCPDCRRTFRYYGRSCGGRKRCGECADRTVLRGLWYRVWAKFGAQFRA